jgi:chloramphenicol 3-O phosphotransferase
MIVLNGGSSSGKSGIARCLQTVLPQPWLTLGIDTFIQTMPVALQTSDAGITITPDGKVGLSAEFRRLEAAWRAGVVGMVRAGARIIVDDVFLSGAASQQRWRDIVGDLDVLWVGVRCDSAVAEGREIARGDRVPGMAAEQADVVHVGVTYDLEIDTTHTEPMESARLIAAHMSA